MCNIPNLSILVITCLNFSIWFLIGRYIRPSAIECKPSRVLVATSPCHRNRDVRDTTSTTRNHISEKVIKTACNLCNGSIQEDCPNKRDYQVNFLTTSDLMSYRVRQLVRIRYPPLQSMLVSSHERNITTAGLAVKNDLYNHCTRIVNPIVSKKQTCFAVAASGYFDVSSNLLRYSDSHKEANNHAKSKPKYSLSTSLLQVGFFDKLSTSRNRLNVAFKMRLLLENWNTIKKDLDLILRHTFGFKKGDTLVAMTVNEGEIELLANHICSCRHHNISLRHHIVFVPTAELALKVNSLGVYGMYHKGFFTVSADASKEYLDPIFTDMMFYKAFSVWLLLDLGYNCLFQDVDIVWLRDPMPMLNLIALNDHTSNFASSSRSNSFRRYPLLSPIRQSVDAIFSDDGQRTVRYAPYYANSGFYFLRSTPATRYFTWSVMTNLDGIESSGSHQNVFNARLIEAVDLAGLSPKLLDMNMFPNGLKFHHDKPFMLRLKHGLEKPFVFHMCWTSNKAYKIEFFKQISMWYLNSDNLTCLL